MCISYDKQRQVLYVRITLYFTLSVYMATYGDCAGIQYTGRLNQCAQYLLSEVAKRTWFPPSYKIGIINDHTVTLSSFCEQIMLVRWGNVH